ncbi:P-loop containing nucleoside triphosphate hydrolase protein [Aureobasidium sp. EXF-10728]|nr:P-loop containing nucleoside triphosphate hydrolase protein [Aureobasidium sp. EXF-10728]
MTGENFASNPSFANDTSNAYFEHASGIRVDTNAVVMEAIRREYPQLHLTVISVNSCNLMAFAASGRAAAAPIDKENDRLYVRDFAPPARRLTGENGRLVDSVKFGKFLIDWEGKEYVVYIAEGRDGQGPYPIVRNQYVLSSSVHATEKLLLEAGRFTNSVDGAVLVFDQGYWQKNHELWESIQEAEWSNVILNEDMKHDLIKDVDNFFDGQDTYQKLKVPWKRGVIYYGPPGNGKTISIKALMHSLYKRKDPVPTLYVRSLVSFGGPEHSLSMIFGQARRYAPCFLIFEDLDTIITEQTRSYFLNEVDGLRSNDGIFMVGSTNHLDRLDPGISKRPSRFDRKYLFPNPNFDQRVMYAHFWQRKLKDNKDIEFPDKLCEAVSSMTDGFSFAYMQEAFVASLLALALREKEEGHHDADLDKLPLWQQLKKQIKILRDELNQDPGEALAALKV